MKYFKARSVLLALLVAALLSGLLLRVNLLFKYPELWFCSDEANLGLMALRFIQQGQATIFIPAESYGGFLNITVMSAFMLISGSPFWGLKLTALLFFVAFAIALFALGRRLFSNAVALLAVWLVCFSPSFLTVMGVREKGPHPEALFLGTLLMWWTLCLAEKERPLKWWYAWGLLAGLSWYVYYLTIVYILPSLLFLLLNRLTRYPAVSSRLFWGAAEDSSAVTDGKKSSGQGSREIKRALTVGLGLLCGSLPYWIFVFKHLRLPPFSSSMGSMHPLVGMKNFFWVGLPIIFGARWSWYREDLVPGLSSLVILLYAAAVAFFLFRVLEPPIRLSARSSTAVPIEHWLDGRLLLVFHLVAYPFLFAFSQFAVFADEPRYLIGLYSSLPLVFAWFCALLWKRFKPLAVVALASAMGVSVYGSLTVPEPVFNTIFAEPTQPVIHFLKEHDLKRFYANYWVVYRVMFESTESVMDPPPLTGANYFDITHERYPRNVDVVRKDPNPAYVAWESEAPAFEEELNQANRRYEQQRIGRFVVFYNITPPLPA